VKETGEPCCLMRAAEVIASRQHWRASHLSKRGVRDGACRVRPARACAKRPERPSAFLLRIGASGTSARHATASDPARIAFARSSFSGAFEVIPVLPPWVWTSIEMDLRSTSSAAEAVSAVRAAAVEPRGPTAPASIAPRGGKQIRYRCSVAFFQRSEPRDVTGGRSRKWRPIFGLWYPLQIGDEPGSRQVGQQKRDHGRAVRKSAPQPSQRRIPTAGSGASALRLLAGRIFTSAATGDETHFCRVPLRRKTASGGSLYRTRRKRSLTLAEGPPRRGMEGAICPLVNLPSIKRADPNALSPIPPKT
jgi:hypothetical protein